MCKTPHSDIICVCSQFLGMEPLSPELTGTSGVTEYVATTTVFCTVRHVSVLFKNSHDNFRQIHCFLALSPWHVWLVDLACWWPYRWPRSMWIFFPLCAARRRLHAPSSAGRPRPSRPGPPRRPPPEADGPWAAATRRNWSHWRRKLLGGLWIPTVIWIRSSHDSRDKAMRTGLELGGGNTNALSFNQLIEVQHIVNMFKLNMLLFKCLGLIGSPVMYMFTVMGLWMTSAKNRFPRRPNDGTACEDARRAKAKGLAPPRQMNASYKDGSSDWHTASDHLKAW